MTEPSSNVLDFSEHRKTTYEDTNPIKHLPPVVRYKNSQVGYTSINNEEKEGGELFMDSKEYIDLRIDGLEKNIDQRLLAQNELFSEKLSTLSAKFDGQHALVMEKLDALPGSFEQITTNQIAQFKKESRNFTWGVVGVAVAGATLIATIAVPIVQFYFSK